MWVGGWPCNLLPNHRHQLTMMKISSVKHFLAWMQHTLVKWNLNLDWHFDPVAIHLFILPTPLIIQAVNLLISTKLSIN